MGRAAGRGRGRTPGCTRWSRPSPASAVRSAGSRCRRGRETRAWFDGVARGSGARLALVAGGRRRARLRAAGSGLDAAVLRHNARDPQGDDRRRTRAAGGWPGRSWAALVEDADAAGVEVLSLDVPGATTTARCGLYADLGFVVTGRRPDWIAVGRRPLRPGAAAPRPAPGRRARHGAGAARRPLGGPGPDVTQALYVTSPEVTVALRTIERRPEEVACTSRSSSERRCAVAREAAGLTVEQVSARTRDPPGAAARARARQHRPACGGSAYARGHLRAIAAVTGADPDALLRRAGRPTGPTARVEAPAPAARTSCRRPAGERPPAALGGRRGLVGASPRSRCCCWSARCAAGRPPARDRRSAAPRGGDPRRTARSGAAPAAPAAAALRLQVGSGRSWVDRAGQQRAVAVPGGARRGDAARVHRPGAALADASATPSVVTVGCGSSSAAAGSSGKVRRFVCAPDGLAPA